MIANGMLTQILSYLNKVWVKQMRGDRINGLDSDPWLLSMNQYCTKLRYILVCVLASRQRMGTKGPHFKFETILDRVSRASTDVL
jgi:hypothetical protein